MEDMAFRCFYPSSWNVQVSFLYLGEQYEYVSIDHYRKKVV